MINIHFRKSTLKDDFKKISELLYYTDNYIYPYWFESLDKCILELPSLIAEDKFYFNYNNLYLAVDDENNVLGLICIVDKTIDLNYDYEKLKKVNERYKFTIENYIEVLIKEVSEAKFAYISNVCVNQNYRNLHIGTFLLDNLIKTYKEKHFNEIALDVLADNPAAIHLYEKMGFKRNSEIFQGFNDPNQERPAVFSMNNDI